MYPCVESIKLFNGDFYLLNYHQERIERTFRDFYKVRGAFSLTDLLHNSNYPKLGLYKVRFVYDSVSYAIHCEPYKIANHSKVKLVKAPELDYSFKTTYRDSLDHLVERSGADDVIYIRNHSLTDAWYSNVVLEKEGKWYTPSTYLLNGVKRRFLLDQGKVIEKQINVGDLSGFEHIAFINALRDFEKVYSFSKEGDILHLNPVAYD